MVDVTVTKSVPDQQLNIPEPEWEYYTGDYDMSYSWTSRSGTEKPRRSFAFTKGGLLILISLAVCIFVLRKNGIIRGGQKEIPQVCEL